MNEHILKVMVWLRDKSFYSQKVMLENYTNAYDAATYNAAYYAAYTDTACAAYYVFQFFKVSGHKRSQYEQEVNKRLNNENN